jgi:hypothetical protein
MNRDELTKQILFDFTRKHKIEHLEYELSKEIERILDVIDNYFYDKGYDAGMQYAEDLGYDEGYHRGYDDCADGEPRDRYPRRY